MTEEGIAQGTGITEGQSLEGIQGTGLTGDESDGIGGQSGEGQTQGTTDEGTLQASDETFFDPKDIEGKPELQTAYKQMQRAFSKKMAGIKDSREKIEAYDAFAADPAGQLQRMASQMGYQITRAEAAQQLQNQQKGNQQWEPQNWQEVLDKATEQAYARLQKEQAPILGEVERLRKSNLETFLDTNAPDWRQYESEMKSNLRKHPSLVNDPLSLYRLSVPGEILESRATQQALKKLQEKGQAAQLSGASTTTKRGKAGVPDKPMTFDEAVKFAQADAAEKGLKP